MSDTDPSLLPLYYIPFYVFEARVTSYYEARVTKSVRYLKTGRSSLIETDLAQSSSLPELRHPRHHQEASMRLGPSLESVKVHGKH